MVLIFQFRNLPYSQISQILVNYKFWGGGESGGGRQTEFRKLATPLNSVMLTSHSNYNEVVSPRNPRVVHGSDGPAGRVGSGHDFGGFWRVGSGRVSTSDF